MNNEEKNGWKMAWAGVGLIVAGCLLTWFASSAESFGLQGILYFVVTGILCVAYVVAICSTDQKFVEV